MAVSASIRSPGEVLTTFASKGLSSFSDAAVMATLKAASNKKLPSSEIAPKYVIKVLAKSCKRYATIILINYITGA